MVYNAARLRDARAAVCRRGGDVQVFLSEVAERVASLAVNCSAANGFVKDYPVEKLYRDAKIGRIYEGTSATCSPADDRERDDGVVGGRVGLKPDATESTRCHRDSARATETTRVRARGRR